MRICALLIFSVLLISLVSAEDTQVPLTQSLPTGIQGECRELIQTCSNCTYVNITSILYPSSLNLTQLTMTKTGTIYNRTFCNTQSVGTYIINWKADPDGLTDSGSYDFKITKSGEDREINPFIPLAAIIFFGIVSLIIGLVLPNPILRYALFGFTILSAYVSIQYTLIVLQGYALVDNLSTDSYLITLFRIFSWIISGAVTLIIIFVGLFVFKRLQITKGFKDDLN